MESERCRRGRRPWQGLALVTSLALGVLAPGAGAQELGDLAGKAKLSDAERAKRDADKVYQWIRFLGDKADKPVRPAAAAKEAQAAAKESKESAKDAAASREAAQRAAAVRAVATASPTAAGRPAPEASAPALASAAPAVPPEAPPQAQLMAAATPSAQPVLPPPAALAARAPAPAPAPAEEEEQLKLLERVEPEFPHRLLQDRGGSVTVRFTVQPDGSVRSVEALKSSNSRLVRGVVDAVSRWRFAPIAQARSAVVEVGFKAE